MEDYHTCSGIFNKPVNAGMDNAGKFAYVEDYHTCSGIFNEPVNAGMDNAGKSRSGIYDVYFCLP